MSEVTNELTSLELTYKDDVCAHPQSYRLTRHTLIRKLVRCLEAQAREIEALNHDIEGMVILQGLNQA